MIDVALLGRLEARLDVESLLLDEDRDRDERRVRLVDLRRRGLRGRETGRLSGLLDSDRWRWDRDRRWDR